jgi:hypothetical protein
MAFYGTFAQIASSMNNHHHTQQQLSHSSSLFTLKTLSCNSPSIVYNKMLSSDTPHGVPMCHQVLEIMYKI